MKIAWFCIPAHGHTNPTLGLVKALTTSGHEIWYFSFADEDHCANWSYHDEWTGDSYWNVTGTDYEYLSDMVIQ